MPVKEKSMTVVQLKAALKAKGLKVSGNKEELKKRLYKDGGDMSKPQPVIYTQEYISKYSKLLRNLLSEKTITISSLNI